MKIKFNFDEKTYESISVVFVNEEEPEDEFKEFIEDLKLLVINPTTNALSTANPDNTYTVEEIENGYKIICSAKDGEEVLKTLYKTLYTLFKFLESDVVDSNLSEEERDKRAKEITDKVKLLSDEEIKSELGLKLDNDEK